MSSYKITVRPEPVEACPEHVEGDEFINIKQISNVLGLYLALCR
jgi:hypothetical protein